MTDTPRTDAAWDESCPLKKLSDTEKREFAQQLERERDEKWNQADTFLARLGETQEKMINAIRERDEWKEMYIEANRERGDWKARYVQQNKDLGWEMNDPNGTIWDHAKTLQKECEKLKSALKVIHTWATFRDGIELVPDQVAKLTAKALNLTKTTP